MSEHTTLNKLTVEENYIELKKALLEKTTEYIAIKELALDYIEYIFQLISYIEQTKEIDSKFISNQDKNEFIFEYYCELSAYKYCLNECLNLIELKNTLEDCTIKIDDRIKDCEYDLYPGFLCSHQSIQEVSILYSILKEFKEKTTIL